MGFVGRRALCALMFALFGALVGCEAVPADAESSDVRFRKESFSPCGDGDVADFEECDGDLFRVGDEQVYDATCEDLGLPAGELRCSNDCYIDTSACIGPGCGNGVVEEGEACDEGPNPRTTCANYGGPCMLCVDCQEVESFRGCGDGVVEEFFREECDGDEPLDCASLGWGAGEATCMDNCEADVSACEGPVCGDGFVTGDELCDPEEGQRGRRQCGEATEALNELVAGCGEGQTFIVYGRATCVNECGEWDLSTCFVNPEGSGPGGPAVPYDEFVEDCLGEFPPADDAGSDPADTDADDAEGSASSPGADASDTAPGSTAADERTPRTASGCSSAGALPTAWWALGLLALVAGRRGRRARL